MGEENKMGLGLMDGFPPALEFWEHWCRSEGDIIGTEKGYPCNWCGAEEKITKAAYLLNTEYAKTLEALKDEE